MGEQQIRSTTDQKLYRLGDRLTRAERERFDCEDDLLARLPSTGGPIQKDGTYVMAVRTGEVRPPRKGEWYLSGAFPRAYRAPNDLSSSYGICVLVKVERKTIRQYTVV